MSFILDRSEPRHLVAKTIGNRVLLWTEPKEKPKGIELKGALEEASVLAAGCGGDTVSMDYEEFLCLVRYVLTNYDLEPGDAREAFVRQMKDARIIKGRGAHPQAKRIELPDWE